MSRPLSALDPGTILQAYGLGVFPMAESRGAKDVLWVRPEERAVLPLQTFHVPRRLVRVVRRDAFDIRVNTAFGDVIRACAERRAERRETWINAAIVEAYERLHVGGHAHSVEAWKDGALVGGLYGVAQGAAFFGESMFSRVPDASKVALVHLAARLRHGAFKLLDAQFPNTHLEQFGAVVIPRARFERLLAVAIATRADFYGFDSGLGSGVGGSSGGDAGLLGARVLQVMTQTS